MKNILHIILAVFIGISTVAAKDISPENQKLASRQKFVMNAIMSSFKANYRNLKFYTTAEPFEYSRNLAAPADKDEDGQLSESAKKAKELFAKLEKDNKKIPDFNADFAVEFPLMVNLVTDGNNQVALCFNDIKFYPGYSEISVFLKMRLGEYNIFFGADKLKYVENSSEGFFQTGRLVLLGDATFKTQNYTWKLKGGEIKDSGDMTDVTSVSVKCGKMDLLKLGGELWLSPEYFIPIDKKGKASSDSTERVKTKIDATINLADGWGGLSDLVLNLNFTPFALKKYKDKVGFNVKNIVLDFSEKSTPKGALETLKTVSKNYEEPKKEDAKPGAPKTQDNGKLWKGLYVESLEVYLPDELKGDDKKDSTKKETKKTEKPLRSFGAKNLVIGDVGLTGYFFGYNLVRLDDEAPISNWDMSVDSVYIDFVNSTCKKFKISGKVQIPQDEANCETKTDSQKEIAKAETSKSDDKKAAEPKKDDKKKGMMVSYNGVVSISDKENKYLLGVKLDTDKKFALMSGTATLKANSALELFLTKKTNQNARFDAKMTINGDWAFAVKAKDANTKEIEKKTEACMAKEGEKGNVGFRKIEMTNCVFMTTSPYFDLGALGYTDTTNNINDYPIFIEKFDAKSSKINDNSKKLGVNVKFRVNLMDKAIAGKGDIGVFFNYGDRNEKFYFEYDKVEFKDIDVKAEFSGIKIGGGIRIMSKDAEFGDGFMGRLDLKVDKVGIKTNYISGIKQSIKYWYLDGMFLQEKLFTNDAKNLSVNGIGLGFAYNMEATNQSSEFSSFNKKYIPKSGRFSLIAGVPYTNLLPKIGDTFDGKVNLAVNFGGSYGLASITAEGDIRVKAKSITAMKDGDLKAFLGKSDAKAEAKNINDSKAAADKADTKEDPKTGAFTANIGVDVNIEKMNFSILGTGYLDMGALYGTYEKKKIGDIAINLGDKGFYAWVGTPSKPLSVKLDMIGDAKLTGDAYFDLGQFPPADQSVRKYPDALISLLGDANAKAAEKGYAKYTLFNPNELMSRAKGGLAMGASLNLSPMDVTYDPFYARVAGGAGFDMVIAKMNASECASGTKLEGMYGSGQLYAYIDVNAGVKFKAFKKDWKFDIIDTKNLIIGKVGAPSPFYIDGLLYGKFKKEMNILGWKRTLIDEEYLFKVNIGQQCVPMPKPPTLADRNKGLDQGIIYIGHDFVKGQRIYTPDKNFYLIYQNDGNLVTYTKNDRPIWASNAGSVSAKFQNDGHFISYHADGAWAWKSNTNNKGAYSLVQQADGNLVIYDASENPLWSSGAYGYKILNPEQQKEELKKGKIYPPFVFEKGKGYFFSQNGKEVGELIFQKDGNFVYYINGKVNSAWSTNGSGADRLVFQEDGNLVLEKNGKPIKASGTNGRGRSIQFDEGGIGLYDKNNSKIWYPAKK